MCCNISDKAMASHSNTLAWKLPWMEEPSRLQSMGSLELDTTERLHFHFSLAHIGEGNCNPLQCSCLENPRDGGAWWAAVYGVAQSRTRLKQRSSSSSSVVIFRKHYVITFSQVDCLFAAKQGKEKVKVKALVTQWAQLCENSWTVACQAPLSTEFSRQEYWSGLPFPSPRDLPDPGIEPKSPASPALSDGFFTTEPPGSLFCQTAYLSQTINEKQIEPFYNPERSRNSRACWLMF